MNSLGKYTCKFVLLGAAAVFVCRYLGNIKEVKDFAIQLKECFDSLANSKFVENNGLFFRDNKKGCLAFFGSTTMLAASGLTFNGSKHSCTFGLLSLASTIATFHILNKKLNGGADKVKTD